MGQNLYEKVFDKHVVKLLSENQFQLFIGLHLIHEVTSPQAFDILREKNISIAYPKRTYATVDHIIPTEYKERQRPLADSQAEEMLVAIEKNAKESGIQFFEPDSGNQGIVHVVGPEKGLTQPGMTIACGDSHTSTHGAFGCLAFGIGTSQVSDILATQTMRVEKLKVRKIQINGSLKPGVYAKDVILAIINNLSVKGGVGYAYEYCGEVVENMTMEERMTLCNMSIEGGAKIGYVNPDKTTFDYLQGKEFIPQGEEFQKLLAYWKEVASDVDAEFDDEITLDGNSIEPFVTWGITPGQSVQISDNLPAVESFSKDEIPLIKEAYQYMQLEEGQSLKGMGINVVFIGSCTNGRISDLEEAARIVKGKKVAQGVKALAVPGSEKVKQEAESRGIHKVFEDAGFQWREAGCSMCLAMNPDKLKEDQLCASTSNRNFKGRQGSPRGRTLLMSPGMAAIAAIEGKISDLRDFI